MFTGSRSWALVAAPICTVFFPVPAPAAESPAAPLDSTPYLQPTEYIDSRHPRVVETAREVTAEAATDQERAIRLHDFVRDEIRFGWAPAFYDQKASEVLRSGVGFCNTKSTLFVALLRAVEIPARQHFVDIDAGILRGLIDPGTAYVDHSFAEVLLGGRWLAVDSYIVDRDLAVRARARLEREGRPLGYGVHIGGTSDWDAQSHAFAQFVDDGSVSHLSLTDHGLFADIGTFYASGKGHNRLGFATRLFFGFFSRGANARIEALRNARIEALRLE